MATTKTRQRNRARQGMKKERTKKTPAAWMPARTASAPEPEDAAIAEDVDEPEERVPEVEEPERPKELAPVHAKGKEQA